MSRSYTLPFVLGKPNHQSILDLTSADKVTLDTGEVDPLSIPINMIATVDRAGHIQGTEGTTLYMADNVWGAEEQEVEERLIEESRRWR